MNTNDKSSWLSRVYCIILILSVLICAFAVIYTSDLNRRLFIQYQRMLTENNNLYIDWGKLLLEQTTWSTQARIQSIAQQKLGMILPTAKDVTIVRQHE